MTKAKQGRRRKSKDNLTALLGEENKKEEIHTCGTCKHLEDHECIEEIGWCDEKCEHRNKDRIGCDKWGGK